MIIPNLSKVTPADRLRGDSPRDTALLARMLPQARAYIEQFSWCDAIAEEYFGLGVGGVVAVFLFKIVPAQKKVDNWLWVVVGDLPPAYLVTDDAPEPVSALKAYVEEMTEWIDAVEAGDPLDEIIPVNAEATLENAGELKKRLQFLTKTIIPKFATDRIN
jgi:hypothetical protein